MMKNDVISLLREFVLETVVSNLFYDFGCTITPPDEMFHSPKIKMSRKNTQMRTWTNFVNDLNKMGAYEVEKRVVNGPAIGFTWKSPPEVTQKITDKYDYQVRDGINAIHLPFSEEEMKDIAANPYYGLKKSLEPDQYYGYVLVNSHGGDVQKQATEIFIKDTILKHLEKLQASNVEIEESESTGHIHVTGRVPIGNRKKVEEFLGKYSIAFEINDTEE